MVIDWMKMDDGNAHPDPPKVRAAEYVRMSTEHQKYSTDNQSSAIRDYAQRRGYAELTFDDALIEADGEYFNSKGRTTFGRMILIKRN